MESSYNTMLSIITFKNSERSTYPRYGIIYMAEEFEYIAQSSPFPDSVTVFKGIEVQERRKI